MKNFDITATTQDIDEFVAVDDESSHVFQDEISEEPKQFEEQQAVNEDENMQRLQGSNVLDNDYANYVILEGELSSAEMQDAIGNNYIKLQSVFNNNRNILK